MAARSVIGLVAAVALLAGCATQSRAPVLDRSEPVSKPVPHSGEYIVKPKDSLYAIAWKYGLDYRDIARWNGIASPYIIHPGQRLVLDGEKSQKQAPKDGETSRSGKPTAVATTPRAPARPAPSSAKPIPAPVSVPAVPSRRDATPVPNRPKSPATRPGPQPKTKPSAAQRPAPTHPGWRWPVNAQPARGFGRGSNGLDYVLAGGHPVVAVAAGEVIYAGAGLGGFRHLIIVEHPNNYMSAYNINVEPAVAEGSKIAGGSKICDIGPGSPASRRLYFEIRRNGTPVNPATIIGKR